MHIPYLNKEHESAYYAGSFYPDAFYNCFGDSILAETAHWPPFLKAAVDYYHQEYTAKGLVNDRLKAFIYGIFTHQVTDVPWHSLQSSQGLLEMITEVEFSGDLESAHSFLDTIGDFIILNQQFQNLSKKDRKQLTDSLSKKWVYPIDDILEIYKRMEFLISKSKLKICMDRGYLALQGEVLEIIRERIDGNNLGMTLKESPLLVSIIHNYYYGGIDQIVNSLQQCLIQLNWWLSESTSTDPWEICQPLFKPHEIKSIKIPSWTPETLSWVETYPNITVEGNALSNELFLSNGVMNSQFGSAINFGSFLDEPTIAISAPYEDTVGNVYLIPFSEILGKEGRREAVFDIISKKISLDHALSSNKQKIDLPLRFGDALFTWTIKGTNYLVISEPGTSRFKVYLDGSLIAILKLHNGSPEIGLPGIKQLTILTDTQYDINEDGYPDMIVGSPFSDSTERRQQTGLVIAISGKKFCSIIERHRLLNFQATVIDINIEDIILQEFQVPKILYQSNSFENFGTSFAATRNDVLIGMNSIGSVIIFDKKSGDYKGLLRSMDPYYIDATGSLNFKQRVSSKYSSLFAFDAIVTGCSEGVEWVAVSASGHSYADNCFLCGVVYLYIVKDGVYELVSRIAPAVKMGKEYTNAMFGKSLKKVSESVVLIVSNGYNDGKGALYMVDLKDSILQDQSLIIADLIYCGKICLQVLSTLFETLRSKIEF